MLLRKETIFALVGLAAIAAIGIFISKSTALAEFDGLKAQSVSVVPIQLGRESYGIAMVDAKNESIWIYEINNRGVSNNRLKLFAARNWHYDKMLEEFNSGEPRPQQVKTIIEQMLRGERVEEANLSPEPNQTEEKQRTE